MTYRDGRPAGIQPVVLQTDGAFEVGAYLPLHLADARASGARTRPRRSRSPPRTCGRRLSCDGRARLAQK